MGNLILIILALVSFIIVMVLPIKSSIESDKEKGIHKRKIRIYRIIFGILFLPQILISFIFSGYPSLNFVYFTIWLTYAVIEAEKIFSSEPHDGKLLQDEKLLIENKNWVGYKVNLKTAKGKIFVGSILTFALALLVFLVISDFYNPSIKINEDEIKVSDLEYSCNFQISEIKSVSLLDDISIIKKVSGGETERYARGKFNVDKFGKSQVYIFKDTNKYIVIELKDTNIIYNARNEKDTLDEYEELSCYLPKK